MRRASRPVARKRLSISGASPGSRLASRSVPLDSGWTTEADRDFFYKSEAAKIPTYNKQLKLFWWGWGETDIARANGLAVIDTFKKQGVTIETMETPGGHEWTNWRIYLHEVAPKLFR